MESDIAHVRGEFGSQCLSWTFFFHGLLDFYLAVSVELENKSYFPKKKNKLNFKNPSTKMRRIKYYTLQIIHLLDMAKTRGKITVILRKSVRLVTNSLASTLSSLQAIGFSWFPRCEIVNEEQPVLVEFMENKQVPFRDLAYEATNSHITAI